MSEAKQYLYKPRFKLMFCAVVFFSMCGGYMADLALTNHRGLIIDRIIPLSPAEADVFYGFIAFLSFLFVPVGLYGCYKALTCKNFIELSSSELKIPKSHFWTKERSIALANINNVTMQTIYRQRIATFYHDAIKTSVSSSFFDNKAVFEDFMETFVQKIYVMRAARQPPQIE